MLARTVSYAMVARAPSTGSSPSAPHPLDTPAQQDYGLRREVLSPMETLAQSVSTIAPTTTPVATIPLVCALAGNGTWLAYVMATVAILLVAWCIGRFARYSSSPGSLYTYAGMILPPWLGATTAWSLLLAYIATASSVIGGFYQYANLLLRDATGHATSTVLLALTVTGISMWIAWRDVKISARLMLWIEAVSVLFILTVVGLVLARHGSNLDLSQLRLRGVTGSGLRLGLVLALFSFVGFESATTLGAEARNPLKTIPRAVIQSSILGGAFFTLCAYTEVLGFHAVGQDLGASGAPMHVLAGVGGAPFSACSSTSARLSVSSLERSPALRPPRAFSCSWHTTAWRTRRFAPPTSATRLLISQFSSLARPRFCPWPFSRPAAQPVSTCTVGWGRSRPTGSWLRMRWFASRCPVICATTARPVPAREFYRY